MNIISAIYETKFSDCITIKVKDVRNSLIIATKENDLDICSIDFFEPVKIKIQPDGKKEKIILHDETDAKVININNKALKSIEARYDNKKNKLLLIAKKKKLFILSKVFSFERIKV